MKKYKMDGRKRGWSKARRAKFNNTITAKKAKQSTPKYYEIRGGRLVPVSIKNLLLATVSRLPE